MSMNEQKARKAMSHFGDAICIALVVHSFKGLFITENRAYVVRE